MGQVLEDCEFCGASVQTQPVSHVLITAALWRVHNHHEVSVYRKRGSFGGVAFHQLQISAEDGFSLNPHTSFARGV